MASSVHRETVSDPRSGVKHLRQQTRVLPDDVGSTPGTNGLQQTTTHIPITSTLVGPDSLVGPLGGQQLQERPICPPREHENSWWSECLVFNGTCVALHVLPKRTAFIPCQLHTWTCMSANHVMELQVIRRLSEPFTIRSSAASLEGMATL